MAINASRKIDLVYPGDAYAEALITLVCKDLYDELSKTKWIGEANEWNDAIKAIKNEITKRYGLKL